MSWTGRRGEAWVAAQAFLLVVVLVVAVRAPGWPGPRLATLAPGLALVIGGCALGIFSARALGRSLTPFPRPRAAGDLAGTGPYRMVRHPMYTGVLMTSVGVSLVMSPWALLPTVALAILLDRKAVREERWLAELRPDYQAFMSRVAWRFVPWLR